MTSHTGSLFAKRPAFIAALFLICGILIALYIDLPYLVPLFLAIATLFAIVFHYLKGNMRAAGRFSAVLLIFLGWYLAAISAGYFPPNHIANLAQIGGRVDLIGRIIEEPDIRAAKTYLVVEPDSVLLNRNWIPTLGKVRVSVNNGGSLFDHADYLKFSGYLYVPEGARNPGGFDYQAYLRSKEIFACMSVNGPENVAILSKGRSFLSTVITPLRKWLLTKTRENLSPVSAAILSGFILGEQRDIPSEYQELFRDTGTLHLMAVSGENVAFVLAIFAFPLTLFRLPKPIRSAVLILVAVFFAILTRLQPSVVRATIMAIIGLAAYGWMRKPDYLNLLGLAGLLMLLLRPLALFDVGMQLSFAATFGLLYALPRILSWLSPLNKPYTKWLFWILAPLVSTIAAQLAVLPLMAHYFQNIPLSGAAANLPVGLLAGFSTMLGVAFYFASLIGWLGHLISIPLEWMISLVIICLRFFSSLPYADIRVASPSWPPIIIYWLGLYFVYEIAVNRRISRTVVMASLVAVNIIIWPNAFVNHPVWGIEFPDVGRNHAWIFSGKDRPTIACFDSYHDNDDADMVLIPDILNHHGGKLDYLLSATPASKEVQELVSEFHPSLLSLSQNSSNQLIHDVNYYQKNNYKPSSNFPAALKIIWDRSDNIDGGSDTLPAFEIDVNDGALLLASWTGVRMLEKYQSATPLKLLELPWSVYAQGHCLKALRQLNPEVLIFSPNKYAVTAPRSREQLTHSQEKIYSTSICGGFSVNGSDSLTQICTMKAIAPERK